MIDEDSPNNSILPMDSPRPGPSNHSLAYPRIISNSTNKISQQPDQAQNEFTFTDPKAWRMAKLSGNNVLEQFQNANYKPAVRSPINIAILKCMQFNDFIMDVECMQTGKEYGHRDMVFVYGLQDSSHLYYTHIATKADDHANQCFIVNNEPRLKISKTSNDGNDWGNALKHVRIIHRVSDGVTEVYFDDMSKPIMTAKDTTFGPGWVGLGTFDDTCMIRKITIYGDKTINKAFPGFK